MYKKSQRIAGRLTRIALALFAANITAAFASAQEQASEAEALILAAHRASQTAETEEQLTVIIEQCRDAAKKGLSPDLVRYNNKLRCWVHNRRGEVRVKNGDHHAASADFEVAVGLGPNNWQALKNRGSNYVRRRQFDRALSDLDKVVRLQPEFAEAYLHRANAHSGLEQFAKAAKDYDVYIDSRPDDADAFAGRGWARFRSGKKKSGVADLYQALRLDPENVAALINRGEAFVELHFYDKAARDFRDAIKADPKSDRAYQKAAWLMATCPVAKYRDNELAIGAAEKAIELARIPTHEHLDTLAAAQANAEKFDEAQRTMVRAMKLASNAERTVLAKRLAFYQKNEPFRLSGKSESTTPKVAERLEGPRLE